MAKRFIQTRDLPKTLWCNDSKVMSLPAMLVEQWVKLLKVNGNYSPPEKSKKTVDSFFDEKIFFSYDPMIFTQRAH
ncbi:MAG: hypothetical protein GQ532_12870 [Methylomarinum sp.]|nr:hypothetical protein [Methylomarinum sp.]